MNCKEEIKQLDTDVLSWTMHSTSYQGTWVHWDIASSKVGQPSSEVTGCLLRKFPLTRAAAHCSIGQAHVLQQPRLNTGCGSRPGGTHRWFPLKVPRPGPELDLHATLHIKLPAPSALLAVCNTFSKIQLYIWVASARETAKESWDLDPVCKKDKGEVGKSVLRCVPCFENTLRVVSLHRLHDLPEVLRWIPSKKKHCRYWQRGSPDCHWRKSANFCAPETKTKAKSRSRAFKLSESQY